MNIFSAKSIGLYSLAIGSAIVFFNFVTSYGEANIHAPQPIAGNYAIVADNLPGCLQHKTLLFQIEQSGIYLNAHLTTRDPLKLTTTNDRDRSSVPTNNSRPTFSGRLQGQKLDLSGSVPTIICPSASQLRLSSSLTQNDNRNSQKLQGQMWLTDRTNAPGAPVNFTAIRQALTPPTSSH
jgi:hypothetical protein